MKHAESTVTDKGEVVAPRTGAWIETLIRSALDESNQSPPARGRGLKQM